MLGRFVIPEQASVVARWLYLDIQSVGKGFQGCKYREGKFSLLWMNEPNNYKVDEQGAITIPIAVLYQQAVVSGELVRVDGYSVEFDRGVIEVELVPLPQGVGVEMRTEYSGGIVMSIYQDLWMQFAERWVEARAEARTLFRGLPNRGGRPKEDNQKRDELIFHLHRGLGLSYKQIALSADIGLGYDSVRKIVQKQKGRQVSQRDKELV